MTQDDIRRHYEHQWQPPEDPADLASRLTYSSPVEDAVAYPIYERLIADHRLRVDGGRVLDVGCGCGRWIRFLLERFTPRELYAIDFAASSVQLLEQWARTSPPPAGCDLSFATADITDPDLPDLGRFDLVNVGNVLFHIPEPEKFATALANLARLVAPDGRIVTTEYLPRRTVRTDWMMVRDRYAFEAACAAAGLRIADIRASCFFANDPMGLDGPDHAVRGHFHRVRANMRAFIAAMDDAPSRAFAITLLADIDRAALAFCQERIAPIDLPSQKLVVLAPA
jgi:SAM-dependent methyltransferase